MLATEYFMLYKYYPPDRTNRSIAKSMPQLDFREALSTPEEKLVSPAATVAAVAAPAPTNQTANSLLRGVGLSRSAWTNIVFVTIASVGGLVCAFYFFNGGELLRAAAAWPNEFLYPRPLSTDKIDIGVQPNPVDQFTKSVSGSSKTDAAAQSPFEKNVWPLDLTQPPTQPPTQAAAPIDTTNPPGVDPGGPGTSLFSSVASLVSGLNLLPPGADTLVQSSYQTATSTVRKTTITRTAKRTISSTRRKISGAKQKIATTTTSATSTARSIQQTATQNQMGMNTVNTVRAPNQVMTGGIGGIGGVGAGAVGAGGVSAVPGGVGGVGGLGGLVGGRH